MDDFLKLYGDISNRLYKYMLKMSGDVHITEEIIQETFYRAMEHMLLSKEELKQSWLFTVSRNLYFDHTRRLKKQICSEELDKEEQTVLGIPEKELDQKIISAQIQEVFDLMNETYREILILREFKELSYSDIANQMNMNITQVKITLFRARKKFKMLYERRYN